MKDPLFNPTPWIRIKFLKPQTSRYYFSNKKVEIKMVLEWEKFKHHFTP